MIRRFKKYYEINIVDVPDPDPIPDPEDFPCINFTLEASLDTSITFTFKKCSGGNSNITVPGNSSVNVCAKEVYPPAFPSNKWKIYLGDYCN